MHLLVRNAKSLLCHMSAKRLSQRMSQGQSSDFIVWIDLEMSGLDLDVHHILEVGCLVTDGDLNQLDQGIDVVVHQPDDVLESMTDWCKIHHGKSGLTEACRSSMVSLEVAQQKLLSYVSSHTSRGTCPLAGNSVHEDRRFLVKYMPKLVDHLHYRIVDVSTIKELCRRWYPDEYSKRPQKVFTHRSLDDIRESIGELRYYRNMIFK